MLLRVGVLWTQLFIALVSTGCRTVWREPRSLSPLTLQHSAWRLPLGSSLAPGGSDALETARAWAADAARAERTSSGDATDKHYLAALSAWRILTCANPATVDYQSAWEIYHNSVARFAATACDEGRFVPGHGVIVNDLQGSRWIPLALHGFVWRRDDVQALHPVGEYRSKSLSRQHRTPGWGAPLVAERRIRTGSYAEEEFLPPGSMFAATALLRPCATGGAVLELHDPLHARRASAPLGGPLASDISAPFALRVATSPEIESDWLSFFGVETTTQEGLFFIEPYQPGKIPVVFIHGVLSNPAAWIDLTNDLRAVPGFADRYQLWAFRYPTGGPFLEAASRLRRDLSRAVNTVDPCAQDPALSQIVLVGHSMGGLVAELQASASGDLLWRSISSRPLHQIVTTDESRQALAEMCYFAPQPNVRRVICLAAPHQGSRWATRPIGRLGARLAQPDPQRVARHEQLLRDNPGVFSTEVADRVPTSIDMLNPDSAILKAMELLPTNPCVHFHTVFGYGKFSLAAHEGDGVVAVESALTPKAATQVGVRASHTHIHRQPETVDEIVRILGEHLQEFDAGSMAAP